MYKNEYVHITPPKKWMINWRVEEMAQQLPALVFLPEKQALISSIHIGMTTIFNSSFRGSKILFFFFFTSSGTGTIQIWYADKLAGKPQYIEKK